MAVLFAAVFVTAGMALPSTASAEPVRFTLANQPFTTGVGVINGSFDYDADTNIASNVNITTSAGTDSGGNSTPGWTFTSIVVNLSDGVLVASDGSGAVGQHGLFVIALSPSTWVYSATPITARFSDGTCTISPCTSINRFRQTFTAQVTSERIPQLPTVTALSPTSGTAAGGTPVTLTGTNFTGATGVSFGGTAAASFTVDSATQITAIAPPNAVGPVDVTVTTPVGTSDVSGAGNDYRYIDVTPPDAPVITTPMSGITTREVTYVAGTAEPNADITVYTTGGGVPAAPSGAQAAPVGIFGRTTADGMGNWSVSNQDRALAAPGRQSVGETPTTLTAEATDAAGNTSARSAPVTLTTDPVPPVTPTVTSPASGATVNSATPTFSGTGEPGSLITVYVDSTEWVQAYVDMSGNWSDGGAQGAMPKGAASGPRAPLSAGPHTWYVTSEDMAGNVSAPSASIPFNIVLLSINETSLSNGAVASAYSASLTTTGCTGPCTFAVTSGALPAGVSLSSAGVFSGTPTAGGVFNFTVTATDAGAGGITAIQAYTLTIAAPTVTSTSTPAAGQRGFAYSQTLVGSGGTGPYTFALQSGALPAGITLSSAGVVSGTPTVIGSFPIVVRVTDSSTGSGPYFGDVNLTLVVNAAAITVTPTTLPAVMAGVAYDRSLSATGGAGTYTYAVTAGALPTGITMTTAGRISGRSFQVGQASFTVTATDSFGNTGSVPLRILVTDRPDPSLDPDTRAVDAAQAEATRRLTGAQIDNVTQRLEDLHSGGGTSAMTNGLTLNSGVMDLGRQADQRTQLGGGRMFDQQTQIDPTRAELNGRLWSASADTLNPAGSIGGGSPLGYGLNAGSGTDVVSGGQPSANAAPVQSDGAAASGVRFWTGGAVTIGERDADSGQAGFSVRSTGVSMGVDFAVNPNFDLGFGGGFGEESADIGAADSSVDSKQFSGVVYASLRPQSGVFIDAMLGYGSLEFDLQRRVTADGSLVMGERDGTAMFGSIGLGYDRPVSIGRMSAYGRIESLDATLDAYTETGSALWALSYAERDVESLQGVLGARYVWSHEERDSTWTPSFRFEYRHEFADGGIQNLQYADWLSGPTYQIQSTGWDRSEINMGLGLNVTTADGWKVTSELGARLATNQTAGTLRLMLSKSF